MWITALAVIQVIVEKLARTFPSDCGKPVGSVSFPSGFPHERQSRHFHKDITTMSYTWDAFRIFTYFFILFPHKFGVKEFSFPCFLLDIFTTQMAPSVYRRIFKIIATQSVYTEFKSSLFSYEFPLPVFAGTSFAEMTIKSKILILQIELFKISSLNLVAE